MQKQIWAWQGQLLWLRDQQRPWECRQEGLVTPAVVPWRGDISNRALRTSQISSETGRRKAEDDVVWEKHNISRRGNDRWPDNKTVKRNRWNYFNKFFLVLHIHYNIFFWHAIFYKKTLMKYLFSTLITKNLKSDIHCTFLWDLNLGWHVSRTQKSSTRLAVTTLASKAWEKSQRQTENQGSKQTLVRVMVRIWTVSDGSVLSGRHYSGKRWEPLGGGVCLAKGH